jgi:DNA ligase (NAD+)
VNDLTEFNATTQSEALEELDQLGFKTKSLQQRFVDLQKVVHHFVLFHYSNE